MKFPFKQLVSTVVDFSSNISCWYRLFLDGRTGSDTLLAYRLAKPGRICSSDVLDLPGNSFYSCRTQTINDEGAGYET